MKQHQNPPTCPLAARLNSWVTGKERGGVMIGAVMAMVVAGVLGAGAASMLGTTAQHEVRANYGERAYYLAESGFNYAYATYCRDGKDALAALFDSSFDIPGGGGRFTITSSSAMNDGGEEMFTVNGEQTVSKGGDLTITNVVGNLSARNGTFQIGEKQYRYLNYDSGSNTMENIIGLDHDDFPVTLAAGTTAKTIDSAELVLRGEYPGSGELNAARTITYWTPLTPCKHVDSGGEELSTFDPAAFPEGQQPTYNITPIAASDFHLSGGGDPKSVVTSDTYTHPQGGTYQRTDLKVQGYDSEGSGLNEVRYHYVPFKHNAAGLGMSQAWEMNNNLLSYDVQIKAATGPWLNYAGMGFMFRAQKQGSGQNVYYSGYGISFLRYNWPISVNGDRDFIPAAVKPTNSASGRENNSMLLVLWEQTGQTTWQWLAYKKLHYLTSHDTWSQRTSSDVYDDYVKGSQYNGDGYFIHDDSTVMIRVVEKMVDDARTNDIQLLFGDARWSSNTQSGRSQNSDAYDVMSNRYGYHQRFSPAGEELWKWPSLPDISASNWSPAENDWFTAVNWDRVNPAASALLRNDEAGIASIVRDAGHTSAGFSNNQENRPELVIHTFGYTDSSYSTSGRGPIHFTDFAVQLLAGGGEGAGLPYIGPIIH